MAADFLIADATVADYLAIVSILEAAKLPSSDFASIAIDQFKVARQSGNGVGAIGMERYQQDGLLRSLVVVAGARGQGVGEALVNAIETSAAGLHLRSIVLLTTTAADFFTRLGYATIARDAMPSAVQSSTEFSSLCPASATCMQKWLQR